MRRSTSSPCLPPEHRRASTHSKVNLGASCQQSHPEVLICCHAARGVEQLQLGGMKLMLHNERAVLDPPKALSGSQRRQQRLFGAGQPEGSGGAPELVEIGRAHV